jgi:hypothetical protein
MRSTLFALALVLFAGPAMAATCEESFQKKGDFFSGTTFSARVQVLNLTVEGAFAQLRPLLARDGIRILSSDASTGTLNAQNPSTPFQRALPIDVFAAAEGNLLNIDMIFTLPGGVGASKKEVQQNLCGILNQLRPGSASPTAAPPTPPATPPTDPVPPQATPQPNR